MGYSPMKFREEREKRRLRESYKKYLQSHSGEAYKCMSFEEWKKKIL